MIDMYKQPCHDLDLCGFSFARYSEKFSPKVYRALYGDALTITEIEIIEYCC